MMKLMSAGDAVSNNNELSNNADDGYSRIGEMARNYGVTLRTLRFYEDKGLLQPRREGATRLYSRRDHSRLKLILLGRKVGFSLRDVKQMMDLYDPASSNVKQFRIVLDKSEKQLARLHKQRAITEEAIGDLSELMSSVRARLVDRQPPQAANG